MKLLQNIAKNKPLTLILILIIFYAIIKLNEISGNIAQQMQNSFISTYIAFLFLGIIIITIYWTYKKN